MKNYFLFFLTGKKLCRGAVTSTVCCVFLFYFLLSNCLKGQGFDYRFAVDDSKYNYGFDIAETTDGNFVAVALVGKENTGPVFMEGLVIKIDQQGNELWRKILDHKPVNHYKAIKPTNDGGCLVFGAAGSLYRVLSIVKLNAEGEEEWIKTYLEDKSVIIGDVLSLPNGGVVIIGGMVSGSDFFILKMNADLEIEWSKIYNEMATANNYFFSIDYASDGGFIFGGDNRMTVNDKTILIKTDSLGEIEWMLTYDGYEEYTGYVSDYGRTAIMCPDGEIAMSCGFYGPNGGPTVFKADLNGNLLWEEHQNLTGNDLGLIANSPDGKIIHVAGHEGLNFNCLSLDGSVEWSKHLPLDYKREPMKLRVKNDGNGYIIVGDIYSIEGSDKVEAFVVVTDLNGNITNEFTIDFKEPVVEVYPNPATEYVNFDISSNGLLAQPLLLTVYAVDGKQILEKKFSGQTKIAVQEDLNGKGIYFYSISMEERPVQSGKFMVVH